MKIICIIPARGGSKGVPGKNIKLLGGKPLILHAVACAENALKNMDIVVTTDSPEIAQICDQQNVTIIHRPKELATDVSDIKSVIYHVLQTQKKEYDLIVLLQPTSPFRKSSQLDEIIDILEQDSYVEGVISVVPMQETHPARMYNLDKNLKMEPFVSDLDETKRRQDLKPVYLRNGCFYAVRTKTFLEQDTVMPKNKKAFIMNADWLLNIDTPRDFMLANVMYNEWENENNNN